MFQANSKFWTLGLLAVLGIFGSSLLRDFRAPWTDYIDANGACWSQSAHNTLRAGLVATAGVPSAFYFGTPPIPPEGYYTHHPALLPLLLAGLFTFFGESEAVARLLPISFSLLGAALLWLLAKQCTNRRAATLCVALFAAMPMELHYGRMVNFEPIDLVWMLSALLFLRLWEQTTRPLWRNLLLAALLLSLCTAWLGYFFVLILAVHFLVTPEKRNPRLALLLFGLSLASLALFLLQIRAVRPGAWQNMLDTLSLRMARHGVAVPWLAWAKRMQDLLLLHIQPLSWMLSAAGAILVILRRKSAPPQRWLGWAALCFLSLSVFYVTVFRNASSIHDYASFYFTIPVALLGGIALDAFLVWCESRGPRWNAFGLVAALATATTLTISGELQEPRLRKPFHILDDETAEPADLIPRLGAAIRAKFPEDTGVICNFLPYYGPQLHYYAQRDLLTCAFESGDWLELIANPENAPVGGVIWLGDPNAREILSALPSGTREEIAVGGFHFCFWKPQQTAGLPPIR